MILIEGTWFAIWVVSIFLWLHNRQQKQQQQHPIRSIWLCHDTWSFGYDHGQDTSRWRPACRVLLLYWLFIPRPTVFAIGRCIYELLVNDFLPIRIPALFKGPRNPLLPKMSPRSNPSLLCLNKFLPVVHRPRNPMKVGILCFPCNLPLLRRLILPILLLSETTSWRFVGDRDRSFIIDLGDFGSTIADSMVISHPMRFCMITSFFVPVRSLRFMRSILSGSPSSSSLQCYPA